MSINILNKYFYNDISNIIIEYLTISAEDAIHNKYIVNLHLDAMFELRNKCKKNMDATFSFYHRGNEDLELDLYFKDMLTVMIGVID